mmetsp:Transcript_76795/g.225449  ORF Transcript_76795/g.225449 Transcript_76795/m.225449 type:complete len:417 (-) Transcript_76795:40-1290(-)
MVISHMALSARHLALHVQHCALYLSLCRLPLALAMDYETYHSLGLDTRFEDKPRTKHDSGMLNINGGLTRDERWGLNFMAEAAARQKYLLPAVAQPRPDVPPGRYIEHKAWNRSSIYPGTVRDWWVWVPAQYTGQTPANLIIFNDGGGFLNPSGDLRATLVLANMITDGALDATVAVFLSPGIRTGHPACAYDDSNNPERATSDDPQRSLEYDSISDTYSRFLLEDIMPLIEAEFRISQDPARRAMVGISSGAVGAFCAAWFRPDSFGLVATISGSYVNIRGAHNLPWVIRNTQRKPIKVFLLSGENDMDNNHGSWRLANEEMGAALEYAGYTHKLVIGTDAHGMTHGGSVFPSILTWLFKDSTIKFAEEPGQWQETRRLLFWACLVTYPMSLILLFPVFRRLARCCARSKHEKTT